MKSFLHAVMLTLMLIPALVAGILSILYVGFMAGWTIGSHFVSYVMEKK